MDFDDLLSKVKPVTRSVTLCLAGDLVAEKERTERALLAARLEDERTNEPNKAPDVARRVRELEAQMEESTTEFVVQAVGRGVWEGLLDEHKPTDEEKEQGLTWGPGFVTAAIAACVVEPMVMTVEQVAQLEQRLSTSQLTVLFNAAVAVNMGADRLPKSVAATATLAASEERSTTARSGESLGASS
jgi:hypothetical protein